MFNEISKSNLTTEFDPAVANLKAKLRATWMDGDYAAFSAYMKPGATKILAGWQIERGVRLLDVACGAGQTAIPAAKTGARVTGVDIASNLIEAAKKQAALKGSTRSVRRRRRGEFALSGRRFRCRDQLDRRDVRAASRKGGIGAGAGLPPGRPSLYGELDAGRHGGSDVQDRRETSTTASGHGIPRPVGR